MGHIRDVLLLMDFLEIDDELTPKPVPALFANTEVSLAPKIVASHNCHHTVWHNVYRCIPYTWQDLRSTSFHAWLYDLSSSGKWSGITLENISFRLTSKGWHTCQPITERPRSSEASYRVWFRKQYFLQRSSVDCREQLETSYNWQQCNDNDNNNNNENIGDSDDDNDQW